jgi:hypothetical protein
MHLLIESNIDKIRQICHSLRVKKLYVFGSVVSDKFDAQSDIDFLISFSEGLSFKEYTENYFNLHYQLREILNREVDIVSESSLSNPFFIQSVNETKALIYEERD